MKKNVVLRLTKTAKNNLFFDSTAYGDVEIAGSDNKFLNFKIYKFKKDHPFIFWLTIISSIAGIIAFINWIFEKIL